MSTLDTEHRDLGSSIQDKVSEISQQLEKRTDANCFSFALEPKHHSWYAVCIGPEISKSSSELYRGYLMITPNDLCAAIDILLSCAPTGGPLKSLHFKCLLNYDPSGNADQNYGCYNQLSKSDALITVYAEEAQSIVTALGSIADHPNWATIEQNRISACGGKKENSPRRPGSHALIVDGTEWRSLCYMDVPGLSEREVEQDPDWRHNREGTITIIEKALETSPNHPHTKNN